MSFSRSYYPIPTAALLLGVFLVSWPRAAEPQAAKEKPKIAVSKETTYVTGPLHEDGTVDFVAALERR